MLRICFPHHRGFGLIMAGIGTLPSQKGTCAEPDSSQERICSVHLRILQRVSCTMSITGLLACGEMIYALQLDKIAVCEGSSWYLTRNPCYLRQFGTRFFTLWDAGRCEHRKKHVRHK